MTDFRKKCIGSWLWIGRLQYPSFTNPKLATKCVEWCLAMTNAHKKCFFYKSTVSVHDATGNPLYGYWPHSAHVLGGGNSPVMVQCDFRWNSLTHAHYDNCPAAAPGINPRMFRGSADSKAIGKKRCSSERETALTDHDES